MRLNPSKQQGFTLIEVTIILLVLVILSTIMLPQLGNFNRLARFVKAREDVGAICASIKKMLDEVMLGAVYADPPPNGNGTLPVGLLVGPGDTPFDGLKTGGDCGTCGGTQAINWQDATSNAGQTMTDDFGNDHSFLVDSLENHLQENDPTDGMAAATAVYKDIHNNAARFEAGAYFGWRGPYFDELTTDPWGNRYAVNTFGLYKLPTKGVGAGFTTAVVCYSAGADRGVDTVINQPSDDADGDGFKGWVFGADDIGAVMSAGGPF